ncbi:MAG: plastocyanin/azurin family copper-binding protein [Halobacteriaceae archaeon]
MAVLALAGCTTSASSDGGGGQTTTQTSSDSGGEAEHFASEAEVRQISDGPAEEATVEMTMLSEEDPVFAPEVAWVKPGGSVTWKNVDEEEHTATAYAAANDDPQRIPDGASAWDSGRLETDATYTQTFDTEGVYDYYCVPHEGLGMVGVVIVGNPDLSGQPAMASLQEDIPKKARDQLSDLHERVRSQLSG